MTAKEYLGQINNLNLQIDFDLKELEYWKELSTTISGCNFKEKYNPNNNTEAPFVKCLIKIKDLEEKISKEVTETIDLRCRIINTIRSLDSLDYQNILELRYLRHLTWEQIAIEMNYSQRWIYIIHSKALKAFERIMEE